MEQEDSGKVIYEERYGIFGIETIDLLKIVDQNVPVYKNVNLETSFDEGVAYIRLKSNDQKHFNRVSKALKKQFGSYLLTSPNKTFEEMLVELLIQKKMTISTAESMTGGLIASILIGVPNASSVINEAYVVYSNKSKKNILGVSEELIRQYGVVSSEVALEMVQKLHSLANSDISISVTGIAGPTGGDDLNPVGSVYIGIKTLDKSCVIHREFLGDRNMIRKQTAMTAICSVLHQFIH